MNINIMNTKRDYTEYCSNGFLLCKKDIPLPWKKENIGEYKFYFSKTTEYHLISNDDIFVLLIGNAYDLESSYKSKQVSQLILEKYKKSFNEAINYITYLAGRFLVILKNKSSLSIIPDSHCTYACYWSKEINGVFTSHLQIFKDYFDVEKDKNLSDIMNHKDYISPGGKYFPAMLTPLKDVYPVIANCFIEHTNEYTEHKRFYPHISLSDKYSRYSKDVIYLLFKNYLLNYFKCIYEKDNTYISLTNGLDSRTILAIALLANLKVDTFTYTKFGGDYPHYEKDLVGASKCATHAGFPHFILYLPTLDYGNDFYKMYSKTFSLHARFPVLAQAYYQQLPIDSNVLVSTISETGTIFYSERMEKNITPEVLAKKWSTSDINTNELVIEEFRKYIEYTEFYNDKISDFDFYDLFYWEHRNSKWANIWYQECDLSHKVILPFNCRLINELMLCLSFEDRKSKYLLNRLIAEAGLSNQPNFYA
ncbi:hypothetical protein [Actinobacillus porcinus]|uniref:hypothetical protein n=1 Tax=Actinobacillus porcinus TaxID=51048 RepID=UPI0023F0769A|nr:hypothetical protein [Actinobacillus porcinus]MDD7545371.1 hypothetical protein [Actinobacillus porcinus]MDY5848712.1 hypothetical protein [Actinobacillus porcinus]